jgi:predicted nucleic acid-binding protein
MTFLDTNICLDLIAKRSPWHVDAEKLVKKHIFMSMPLGMSVISIPVLAYLLKRHHKAINIEESLFYLTTFLNILDVNQNMAKRAIHLSWPDIEDAIQYECAFSYKAGCIITRNKTDFKLSLIPVLTAGEWNNQFA